MNGTLLRVAREDDARAICEIYAPAITEGSTSFELEVPTEGEMRKRMQAVSAAGIWLVAERGGVVAGYAYAGDFRARAAYRWTRESSVYIGKAHHRTGLGRTLMLAIIDVTRALGYRTLIAGATLPNRGSEALHLSLGFKDVGTFPHVGRKNGEWHDVGFWSLDLGLDSEPVEPLASLPEAELHSILRARAENA